MKSIRKMYLSLLNSREFVMILLGSYGSIIYDLVWIPIQSLAGNVNFIEMNFVNVRLVNG